VPCRIADYSNVFCHLMNPQFPRQERNLLHLSKFPLP
jgi:hypothetical protein